jgi:hypothetical protein
MIFFTCYKLKYRKWVNAEFAKAEFEAFQFNYPIKHYVITPDQMRTE